MRFTIERRIEFGKARSSELMLPLVLKLAQDISLVEQMLDLLLLLELVEVDHF